MSDDEAELAGDAELLLLLFVADVDVDDEPTPPTPLSRSPLLPLVLLTPPPFSSSFLSSPPPFTLPPSPCPIEPKRDEQRRGLIIPRLANPAAPKPFKCGSNIGGASILVGVAPFSGV